MENASKALIIAGAILISILLITIGIVLINSGRDIAETGTSGMSSQKMQAFNAQFLPYEGVISGTSLKRLHDVVQTSNAVYPDMQVQFGPRLHMIDEQGQYEVTLEYADGSANYPHDVVRLCCKFSFP